MGAAKRQTGASAVSCNLCLSACALACGARKSSTRISALETPSAPVRSCSSVLLPPAPATRSQRTAPRTWTGLQAALSGAGSGLLRASMAADNPGSTYASIATPRLDHQLPGLSAPALGPESIPAHTASSATYHEHGLGHGHGTSLASDPTLEPTIRALLDQQADIEARLAVLLPQKYGPHIRVELDMLRHKLRALRAFAGDNREWHYLYFRLHSHVLLFGSKVVPRALDACSGHFIDYSV